MKRNIKGGENPLEILWLIRITNMPNHSTKEKKSRPIKFRAWDNGKMLQNVVPCFQEIGGVILVAPNGYNLVTQNGDTAQVETEFVFLNAVIMQFTGLLDKNEKEIYEGDILKTRGGVILKVEWDIMSAGFCIHNGYKFYKDYMEQDTEIIGNIYKNPKLLN